MTESAPFVVIGPVRTTTRSPTMLIAIVLHQRRHTDRNVVLPSPNPSKVPLKSSGDITCCQKIDNHKEEILQLLEMKTDTILCGVL